MFVGVGAHRGTNMGIEGETTPKIVDGIDFLRDVNLGKEVTGRGQGVGSRRR